VRRSLSDDLPSPAHDRDYGRALERAESFPAARDRYHRAITESGSGADATLVTSYERMRYRTTPELAAGGSLRSDPQAWAWRAQAGGVLPFGSRHSLGVTAWHDSSSDWHANQVVGSNVLAKTGNVTGLGTQLLLGHRAERSLLLGTDLRYAAEAGVDSGGVQRLTQNGFHLGGQLEAASNISKYAHVNLHLDANEKWNEAPITVHEGGTTTGATGHLFLFPESRAVLFDGGAQARQLRLSPQGTPQPPKANQLLIWAGVDVNLWTEAARVVHAEALDERLVRRVYLNDAGVLAYRHYDLWTDAQPDFRIALAPRASIDNGTLSVRKALAHGRIGIDLHGGGGYDHIQDHTLFQIGGAFVLAMSWSTRLQASYDLAHETATGLPGNLQIGWLTFHADI